MLAGLAGEGEMMLTAVVRDLLEIPGVDVVICRDARLRVPQLPVEVHWVEDDWRPIWHRCLQSADRVLPIAPETDGVLESLCREAVRAGKPLLNSRADAVAVAASKQRTLESLALQGIAVIQSWRADALPPLPEGSLVVKPDQGVGCQDAHLVADEQALHEFLKRCADPSSWVVQPYLEGQSASLSLLAGDGCTCLLGRNTQRVVQMDDGFLLLGCEVNGLTDRQDELLELAQGVSRAIPGLWGYVGVDLIVTEQGPVVLEVNPRLTTSYVGLSRSLGRNAAALLLQLADDPRGLPVQRMNGECVRIDVELGRVA
jgi:predicted ATP-grasp superfamily ATP-dependent carboligase